MGKELVHASIAIATFLTCGYIYTIDHTTVTPVFIILGSVVGFYFGKAKTNDQPNNT